MPLEMQIKSIGIECDAREALPYESASANQVDDLSLELNCDPVEGARICEKNDS